MTRHAQIRADRRTTGALDQGHAAVGNAPQPTCMPRSKASATDLERTTEFTGRVTLHDTVFLLARATAAMCDSLRHYSELYGKVVEWQAATRSKPFSQLATPARGNPELLDPTVSINALRPDHVIADRFRIVRFIDRGGMGEVYEAQDLAMRSQPRVALKVIRQEIAANRTMVARIERETQLSRRVTHPNVCRTYDLGIYTVPDPSGNSIEVLFLTMELLSGATLASRLTTQGPFTTSQALPLIRQIAGALNAVHDAGIVHCDVKPGNIMLAPVENQPCPRVVLTDFGLARPFPAHPASREFMTHLVLTGGTPDYMSPEQVRGISLGPSSDIYALGLLMYRMLTGTLPFAGTSPESRMRKRLQEHPAFPAKCIPGLDPRWERAILKCLSMDPGQRYASARELMSALDTPDN